jgi:hypothetical protein
MKGIINPLTADVRFELVSAQSTRVSELDLVEDVCKSNFEGLVIEEFNRSKSCIIAARLPCKFKIREGQLPFFTVGDIKDLYRIIKHVAVSTNYLLFDDNTNTGKLRIRELPEKQAKPLFAYYVSLIENDDTRTVGNISDKEYTVQTTANTVLYGRWLRTFKLSESSDQTIKFKILKATGTDGSEVSYTISEIIDSTKGVMAELITKSLIEEDEVGITNSTLPISLTETDISQCELVIEQSYLLSYLDYVVSAMVYNNFKLKFSPGLPLVCSCPVSAGGCQIIFVIGGQITEDEDGEDVKTDMRSITGLDNVTY